MKSSTVRSLSDIARLADRKPLPARFLIPRQCSPELLRQSSESLAGRLETIPGSRARPCGSRVKSLNRHWQRGGFPLSFLARSNEDSANWRAIYSDLFSNATCRSSASNIPAAALLAILDDGSPTATVDLGLCGSGAIARIGESTVRRYLDLFTGLLMVRQLQPWHENLKKRQVRHPKSMYATAPITYIARDTDGEELLAHPKGGASWEGYAVEEILKSGGTRRGLFWATHQGAELDLLLFKGGRRADRD